MKHFLALSLLLGFNSATYAMDARVDYGSDAPMEDDSQERGQREKALENHVKLHGVNFFIKAICEYQGKNISDLGIAEEISAVLYYPCGRKTDIGKRLWQNEEFENMVVLAHCVNVLRRYVKSYEKPFLRREDIRDLSIEQILKVLTKTNAAEFAICLLAKYQDKLTAEDFAFLLNRDSHKIFNEWRSKEILVAQQCLNDNLAAREIEDFLRFLFL